MIKFIKKVVPNAIKNPINKKWNHHLLKKNYKDDFQRYSKYSFGFGKEKKKRHYESDLIFYYHKIEKGLALPKPRVGFGKKNITHLVSILEKYVTKYGWDETSKISLQSLIAYYDFNIQHGLQLKRLYNKINSLKKTLPLGEELSDGGVFEVTKSEIDKRNINFKDFAYTRYSIRDFAPGEVSLDLINEAVYIAQKTPSVCNRQSSKVYINDNEEVKKEILKHQNGNAGFGKFASKILIITSELKDFRRVGERNQSYIDGGLYAMSLIYALHSLGVGTCPLNLSLTYEPANKLRKAAKISDSEVLIMMIAVGHLPEKLRVSCSPRRKVDEVLTVIK